MENIKISKTTIPKTIHYVWMGKSVKSKHIMKCMKTWNKLKDYNIIEWNENNFDINCHPFVKKAYEAKKWAFVSDYVRFYVIFHYGGVYFDTDIIVVNQIDDLLNNTFFVGYEDDNYPFTAVFGAIKRHEFAKKVLDYYNAIDVDTFDFNDSDNNTISISKILIDNYNCKVGNIEQDLKNGIHVYPKEILCKPSMKSKTIHAFTSTWVNHLAKPFKYRIRLLLITNSTNKFSIAIYLFLKKISNYLKI